ncbi:MAG: Gfo/Idh/MocA family oxidoreductase [Caldilineaceae bacterium SB0666_bin_21]|nr:Gfo/Idh/MocA family oxidoreductase [Caldilineaceae bacterium SB0666_bin_21]
MDNVRIGIVGCGAIAQVHHAPNLKELWHLYDLNSVCDVSAKAAAHVADRFDVPSHFTDYAAFLASDIEAVVFCQTDPKTDYVLQALDAGKHVFVEKPVCFNLDEISAMVSAQERAGVVGQAGYMKVYDPAFEVVAAEAADMDVRFVQIHHLHPTNDLHLAQFDVQRFDDVPAAAIERTGAARQAALVRGFGTPLPDDVARAFFLLSGSMIHDLYGLRHIMGVPIKIHNVDIWQEGRAVTFQVEYANGARCNGTWIDLPDLWDFKETLEVCADDKRVTLKYPTGFSRGQLSEVTVQEIDANGMTVARTPAIDWASAFIREMQAFHGCIRESRECRTPLSEVHHDVGLIINLIKSHLGIG